MTYAKAMTALSLLTAVGLALSGCQPSTNSTQFTVATDERIAPPNAGGLPGPAIPLVGMTVKGSFGWAALNITPSGSLETYLGETAVSGANLGAITFSGLELPAYWSHYVTLPSYCQIPAEPAYLVSTNLLGENTFAVDNWWSTIGGTATWECVTYSNQIPDATTRFAYTGSIPSSVTLSALNPFSTQYGLPQLYVFSGLNATPTLATTLTASSVSSDGATATFQLPSTLKESAYAFETVNQTSSGIVPNSINFFAVAKSQTLAGSPFGVSVGSQTVNFIEANSCVRPPVKTTSSSNITFPVVSLYSTNQVNVNG